MHPSIHARTNPAKPAIIMAASGETISFGELDARSNRVAQLIRARGIAIGDTVAICMENHPWYFALTWGENRKPCSLSTTKICSHSAPANTPSPECQTGAWRLSDRDRFAAVLLHLLPLRTGHCPPGLTGDLRDDVFLLVLGQVLDQEVVGALHLRVAVDLLQNSFADALLTVKFAHLVEDDGAFEPLAGHRLDVAQYLGFSLM